MNKLHGLIFDVDGVIADTEPPTAVATIKAFEDLFGIKGVKNEDFEAGLGKGPEAYINGYFSCENFANCYSSNILRMLLVCHQHLQRRVLVNCWRGNIVYYRIEYYLDIIGFISHI